LVGKLEGRTPIEDASAEGIIIFECILKNRMGYRLDSSGLKQGPVVGSCEGVYVNFRFHQL
jgi:hypothetical protein